MGARGARRAARAARSNINARVIVISFVARPSLRWLRLTASDVTWPCRLSIFSSSLRGARGWGARGWAHGGRRARKTKAISDRNDRKRKRLS